MYTVHVCPHLHWDREWASPLPLFRLRLVRMMDCLLALLALDPAYRAFHLDGQTALLENYLAARPEHKESIARHVARRRLGVGPWYVQADGFFPLGEALVRNLLIGQRQARAMGGVSYIGYLPDSLGHPSQMPQILSGFGIATSVLWRGLSGQNPSELWWEAPDGSRVLLLHLPTYAGYENGAFLSSDREKAIRELISLARYQAGRSTISQVVVMLGGEQAEPREDLTALLAAANQASEDFRFVQSRLDEYAEAAWAEISPTGLAIARGELRQPSQVAMGRAGILPNVLSSRVDIRQAHASAQFALIGQAEPLCTLRWVEGELYPHFLLDEAWRLLLRSQAHDLARACALDEIGDEVLTNLRQVRQAADWLTRENLARWAAEVDTTWVKGIPLFIYNPLPWPRREAITLTVELSLLALARALDISPPDFQETEDPAALYDLRSQALSNPTAGKEIPPVSGFTLRTKEGDEVSAQLEEFETLHSIPDPLHKGPAALPTFRARLSFPVELPPCGFCLYDLRPSTDHEKSSQSFPTEEMPVLRTRWGASWEIALENSHLRVAIGDDGTLNLYDKLTELSYPLELFFEDGGEAGDGYTYSPPNQDVLFSTEGMKARLIRLPGGPWVERCRLEYDLALPLALSPDRKTRQEELVPCPLALTISLARGARQIAFEVEFDNQARDHRLRAIFRTDIKAGEASSDTPFDVVTRPLDVPEIPAEVWIEDPPRYHPLHTFVDISHEGRGLALLSCGLHEYELLEKGTLALTLLRAFGWLSDSQELKARKYPAGPHLPAPAAQLPGPHRFRFALFPHRGNWELAEVWREGLAFNLPPSAIATGHHSGFGSASRSLLSIQGRNLALSGVKRSEDGYALILRLYNPGESHARGTISWPKVPRAVYRVSLGEEIEEPLPIEDNGQVRVELGPKKIITLQVHFGS
ncbi:MAG: alpha-mannosidase [Anaerolineae bacterium]